MKQNKKIKHVKKRIIVIGVFLMFPMFFGCAGMINFVLGCNGKYKKNHPALYSVAVNSVLGTTGFIPDGHGPFPSLISLIEEDSLGRVMFVYYERKKISRFSLIISQKSDGEYAYYYPDYNFISISGPPGSWFTDTSECTKAGLTFLNCAFTKFKDEEIEELRRKNDWNMPIDIDKCERAEIVRRKPRGPVRKSVVRSFYRNALEDDANYNSSRPVFFAEDNYGRSMYLAYGKWGSGRYFGEGFDRRVVVLFFQLDGSYDVNNGVMELTDLNNYQDDLRTFKARNNWNVKP
ncbi:MAG: hypothetical protein LBC84_06595 [Prevotellaceae bacterium]|jgi:hypothetical protein|nr:hypothetical protein [Prevotellaceae bacterium]